MITDRLAMIFTGDELGRMKIWGEKYGCVSKIIADVHGMKCYEAKRFINNMINVVRVTFQLVIIHGYNHGTAIKDMLAQNFLNNHIYIQCQDYRNQGKTRIFVRA